MTCEVCPAGSSCTDGAAPSECSAGDFSAEGQLDCSACATGTTSTAAAASCDVCDAASGYYDTDAEGLTCEVCPAGSSCTDGAAPTVCAAGTWSAEGQLDCDVCDTLADDGGRFVCSAFEDGEGDGSYASTCTGESPFAGSVAASCDALTGDVTIDELGLECAAGFYDADEFEVAGDEGGLARRLEDTARECIE